MNDIHQEWRDLRAKNGEFLNHLDCAMAKIEKEKVELKRREQKQDVADATAFAMQKGQIFYDPMTCTYFKNACCQDDRDILKTLNKAQADRIKTLEDELLARKEQQQVDLAIKKDLDKKLDKAAADYKALWVEKDNLADTISRMEKAIRDLDERNGVLRERLANTNASLKRSVQRESDFQSRIDYLEHRRQCQSKEIERLQEIVNAPNGSCSASTQHGMQSKIAKQAAEIKRLTEENKCLNEAHNSVSQEYLDLEKQFKASKEENKQLHKALDISAKDAEVSFNRGRIKGMEEIWDELKDCYDGRPIGENQKIFGYHTVGDILMNLSPTWFINRAEEYHKQEKEEARDIQIGDEVQCFDLFCPDDDPHSDIGIVVAVDSDGRSFAVIGPNFEGCFDTTDIQFGTVKKTGRHFESIPLDYLA